jgi:uncharacterized membrane protein YoaK (UPF0700 family)
MTFAARSVVARSLVRGYVADERHGPLPGLLLALTVATGLIDAVSILALGRVFVANMTGNVVFIGFALAGAPGFSLSASLSALAGFLVGALVGGALIGRFGTHRGVLLRDAVGVEAVCFAAALVVVVLAKADALGSVRQSLAAAALALGMGIQNAVVRRLAVPDLTTTVLTMTLTGLAADLRSGNRSTLLRRLLAVLAMLLGAVIGALLVLKVDARWALGVAVALVLAVWVGTLPASRSTRVCTRSG